MRVSAAEKRRPNVRQQSKTSPGLPGASLQQEFDTAQGAKVCHITPSPGLTLSRPVQVPVETMSSRLEAAIQARLLVCEPHHHISWIAKRWYRLGLGSGR